MESQVLKDKEYTGGGITHIPDKGQKWNEGYYVQGYLNELFKIYEDDHSGSHFEDYRYKELEAKIYDDIISDIVCTSPLDEQKAKLKELTGKDIDDFKEFLKDYDIEKFKKDIAMRLYDTLKQNFIKPPDWLNTSYFMMLHMEPGLTELLAYRKSLPDNMGLFIDPETLDMEILPKDEAGPYRQEVKNREQIRTAIQKFTNSVLHPREILLGETPWDEINGYEEIDVALYGLEWDEATKELKEIKKELWKTEKELLNKGNL